MRKIINILISAVLMTVLVGTTNRVAAATDYTSEVTVTDWDILDNSGGALSTANSALFGSRYQLSVHWTLTPAGNTLHEGDTLSISIPQNAVSGNWGSVASAYEDFTDTNGIIVGKWRINNNKIDVIFSANIEGSSSISAWFLTGANALTNNTSAGGTQNVTMGTVVKPINFKQRALNPLTTNDAKLVAGASNSEIKWYAYINNQGDYETSRQPWGSNFTIQTNSYFEDTLKGTFKEGSIVFYGALRVPITLANGVASSASAINPNISTLFTKVNQNIGESYVAFKSRLTPGQYGVYTDDAGVQTVVAFFGDIGNNGLKYSTVNPNFYKSAATATINGGYYGEADRADLENYYLQVYGDGNSINGNIQTFVIHVTDTYNKVVVNTPISNTATITKGGVAKNFTVIATLQGNAGGATSVTQGQAKLFLFDEETNVILSNATFKLQYKDTGGIWQNYAPAGILTTVADGVLTPALPVGTYRFVQLTTSTNEYDLTKSQGYNATLGTVISEEFVMAASDTTGHQILVSNIRYRFNVTYTKGTHGTFVDDVHDDVLINSTTPTFAGSTTGETGYTFAGWNPQIAETVTENTVYTAQWTANEYVITYVLDNGVNNASNPNTYTYGIGVAAFEPATKDGYEFIGWFDSASDGNEITDISQTATGDKILYARWIASGSTTDNNTTDNNSSDNNSTDNNSSDNNSSANNTTDNSHSNNNNGLPLTGESLLEIGLFGFTLVGTATVMILRNKKVK